MNYKTRIFDDAAAVARGVADLIAAKARQHFQEGTTLSIGVSGGSTPKALFLLLADEEYRESIPWETIRLYWVDERCVPPTHSESNFGMTYDALLQYSFIPLENIFRMKGEDIPDIEAIRYAELLHRNLPAHGGIPVFDLILLGMGNDGHTASIFPNQMELLTSLKSVEVATHPISGQKRITLTGSVINAAEQVVFMITGSDKADIVATIVGQTEEAKKFPASYVHDKTGNTEFYMDRAAAISCVS